MRISSLNHKFKLCRYNVGKYFIFEQPAFHLYFCGTSEGDQYVLQIIPEVMADTVIKMGKGELSTVISGYRRQCECLGVQFHMGQEVTEQIISEVKPDSVILATGSRPLVLPVKGIDGPNVVTAEDVLYGNVDIPAGPVVVCGGGEVGGETAEFISQTNRDVTILEMRPQILVEMIPYNMIPTMERLYKQQINIVTNATVSEITSTSVAYKDKSGADVTIPATTVVSAFGYRAYNPLEESARRLCSEVHVIGSAVKAGNALTAIREGYTVGLAL